MKRDKKAENGSIYDTMFVAGRKSAASPRPPSEGAVNLYDVSKKQEPRARDLESLAKATGK